MFLEELLQSPDFGAAIGNLARPFRERWGLPEVHQLGLVVPDVENAADALKKQNIGPFFIAVGAPRLWQERGQGRQVQGKMALARYRGVEVELLEPLEGSDFYTGSVDPQGRPVLHHIGFFVEDVEGWADRLVRAGYPIWVRGRLGLGPLQTDFAYMDTPGDAGVIVEFIRWRIFGVRFVPPGPVLKAIGGLERWLGFRLRA
ncbi:MAG: VOC family protein [Anaerolineae bacterium]|nr:VOC family protein [Anaerolineae bacterium]